MSRCIRCNTTYREPSDERGDHDCPGCGLTPENRAKFVYEQGHWTDENWTERESANINQPTG